MAEAHTEEHTHHGNYLKIWAILVVLLAVSVIGPFFGIKVVTLVTAFGIAVIKAYMVAVNFMHINGAPRYVLYLVTTCLLFMLLFFAGVAPDVMKDSGAGWDKTSEWQTAHEVGGGHAAEGDHH
jgi:caa(3)-type oxidase subunit IV